MKMGKVTLFMVLLGCRPKGRNTEQHDVFFGVGETLRDLIPAIKKSWAAAGEIHIDAWREVHYVDGYVIQIEEKAASENAGSSTKKDADLFFINLGGYKENEFNEFHYKMLVVADNLELAKSKAKKTAFFKHTSLGNSANTRSATAHIDDKFGIDIDDMYTVKDLFPDDVKQRYSVRITPDNSHKEDALNLGYFRLKDL